MSRPASYKPVNFKEISSWLFMFSSCISGSRLKGYRDIRTYNKADVYIMYTCTYHDAMALPPLFVLRHLDSDHHLANIELIYILIIIFTARKFTRIPDLLHKSSSQASGFSCHTVEQHPYIYIYIYMRDQFPLGDARTTITGVKCFFHHKDKTAMSSEVCFINLLSKCCKTPHSELVNSRVRYYRFRRCSIAFQQNQV